MADERPDGMSIRDGTSDKMGTMQGEAATSSPGHRVHLRATTHQFNGPPVWMRRPPNIPVRWLSRRLLLPRFVAWGSHDGRREADTAVPSIVPLGVGCR